MIRKDAKIPTQRAIAEAVCVSRETVSHILNGKEAHRYNQETRQKVHDAARRLGYHPNRAAQIMRKGKSNLIGIIHFGTANFIARQTAHFLPQAINLRGYETLVMDLSWHGNSHRRALEHLIEARVEGVIISHMVEFFESEDVELFQRAGIPVVTLFGGKKPGIPAVYADSRVVFRQMVRRLYKNGHRQLMLLTNDYQSRTTLSRIAGFSAGMEGLKDTHGKIVQLPSERNEIFHSGDLAFKYVRQLIVRNALPDAIVATNDRWARGVFAAALAAGLSIPGDLAVTGFDNEPFSAQAPYYLTTASPSVEKSCEKAVEVIADLIVGKSLSKQEYVFPSHLIIRKSCGKSRRENMLPTPIHNNE